MLESYRDGEDIPEFRLGIEGHLRDCEFCRMQLRRIEDTPVSAPAAAGPATNDDLSGLLSHLRTWEAGLPAPQVRGGAIRTRAAQEIGKYLGGKAAQRIVQPVTDDAANLLPAIQPFLGRFLGRKAASNLSSHIIEIAVMRR